MESVFDKMIELKRSRVGKIEPKPTAPKDKPRIRTIGNLDTIVESQRIYNPTIPPTNPMMSQNAQPAPAPKGPPASMVHTGTAGASDLEGSWGKPVEK